MNKELYELTTEAGLDSIVYEVLENAGIESEEEKYDEYFDAVKSCLFSISFDLPDSREDIESLL